MATTSPGGLKQEDAALAQSFINLLDSGVLDAALRKRGWVKAGKVSGSPPGGGSSGGGAASSGGAQQELAGARTGRGVSGKGRGAAKPKPPKGVGKTTTGATKVAGWVEMVRKKKDDGKPEKKNMCSSRRVFLPR